MKLLVETTGNFVLSDFLTGTTIEAYRPTVVEDSSFIERMRGKRLKVLEELADEADDATLAAAKDAEELEVAIAELPRPSKNAPKPEPKPEPKSGKGKKKD